MEISYDSKHWMNLRPPLAPSEEDVLVYKRFIGTRTPVGLLGLTPQLMPLCDFAVDLNPNPGVQPKPVITCDWMKMDRPAKVIIGDGVLNLAGFDLIDKASGLCSRLICRVFLRKLPGMKFAEFFPTEFPGASEIVDSGHDTAIVIWDF